MKENETFEGFFFFFFFGLNCAHLTQLIIGWVWVQLEWVGLGGQIGLGGQMGLGLLCHP